MKKNILIIIAGLLVFMSSCKKDFLDVNEQNPNSPSAVEAKYILPAALNAVATTMNNPRRFEFVYLWHGLWSISAGYSQPEILTQYKLINASYQNAWIELYRAGNNFNLIELASTGAKDANYAAIAKIMKAYIFQNLVDCWGDVPYTEAFQAPANLKPKYDKQQVIYEDLVVQLDAAMALIQGAPSDVVVPTSGSDIVYGGNMGLWLKFANTLKLRILIHQSGMDGRAAYITGKIATTAAIGYLSAGESALNNPGYVVSQGKMNPFYETFYDNAGSSLSDGITYYFAGKDNVDYLKATTDPRISKFWQSYSTTSESYAGNIFGTPPAGLTPQASTSKLGFVEGDPGDPGTMIGTPTKSAPILTDFESLFIQAEAAKRGLLSGDAKSLYESAVAQSFAYMGLPTSLASIMVNQDNPKVNYTLAGADKELEVIMTQKWVALNGVAPVEIWDDYRRTGFPSFIHFSTYAGRAKDTPPVRLLYPQDEINVNNANVLAVGTIDAFTSKIFWQKR